jgi:hypothetical protein
MNDKILIGICMALFFVVIFLVHTIGTSSVSAIPGFWVASDQFKEDANIDQLIMYIGKGEGYMYKGYLIMVVDVETVYNDVMKFKITPKGYYNSEEYSIVLSESPTAMPQKMSMTINVNEGHLTLKCLKDKKIYAEMFKDNQMSAKTMLEVAEDSSDVGDSDE